MQAARHTFGPTCQVLGKSAWYQALGTKGMVPGTCDQIHGPITWHELPMSCYQAITLYQVRLQIYVYL